MSTELQVEYTKPPESIITVNGRLISIFETAGENIDQKVVTEFGEEWTKFNEFDDEIIKKSGDEYFDILPPELRNKKINVLDIGCGTGRWTKYLSYEVGFIEAVDPSNAIFSAAKLLRGIDNVRLTKASVETLPFPDNSFDMAMSIGVLHHIPNTQQALSDCVKKVKKGGYFYVFLYYNFDKRGPLFKAVFMLSDIVRKIVSSLSGTPKKIVCDLLAVFVYLPIISIVRFLRFIGLPKIAKKLPLSSYYNKNFFVIRTDALDRFGTRLEQRFSEAQIRDMMTQSGLGEIVVSQNVPLYHAIGKKL